MRTTTHDLATVPTEILKTDCKGRIRFPARLREELLDRFEPSSMSGAEFAEYDQLKYTTVATWRQKLQLLLSMEVASREPEASPPEEFGEAVKPRKTGKPRRSRIPDHLPEEETHGASNLRSRLEPGEAPHHRRDS